jgi:hypothetical protein
VNSPVRFSAGFARVCALRGRLWRPIDRALVLRAGTDPEGHRISGHPRDVFPPLVGVYVTVGRMYRAARPLVTALFRLHEIENIKLLWRAAVRGRAPLTECWRPLEPLATVTFAERPLAPADLVQRLSTTPYRHIARALFRGHAGDLPAVEMGLDRWAWQAVRDESGRLSRGEQRTRELVRLLIIEHDLDLLRRGRDFGLDADLVAKATIVLAREHGVAALMGAVSAPVSGLASVLPPRLARLTGEPRNWDDAVAALRRARLRQCRRSFSGWPYQLAPAIALLLLRDAQARAMMAVSASPRVPLADDGAVALVAAATAMEG